ncbi:MAG: InlB B-repeat-containing protein, partial [Paludibacteraceae bacterium]|nr:InlB B-repeat-containing protein [Paludibacteraceae bacterium]
MKKLFSIFFALALLLPVSIQAQTDDLHIPQAAKSPEAIQVETLETSTKCVAIADYRSNSSYRLFQMQIYITAAGGEAVSYCFCVAAKVSSPYTGWTSTTFDKSNSSIYTYNALPSSNTIDGTKRATASTVTGSVTRVWGNYYLANVYITFTTSPYNKTYHLKSYFLAPNTESAFAQDSESSVLNLGVDMNDGATTTQSGTTTKLQTQGTSYAGVYTYNWTANVVFPNMNKAYVPTGSYTIDNTGSNGTVSASTANANYSKSIVECCIPNVQCFYWHPRSGNVVIINPNHVSDPMYFQMLFNNTYFGNASYTQLLVRNSIPSLYSLTVSTAGTGANGSASISCAEGHGYPSGGFLSGSSGDYYYEGTTVTLVAPSANPGYHFVNWTKGGSSVSTSQTYDLGNVSSSNSGAYVANFDANTYNVVFNANGGSGTMSNQSHTYGQSKALTTNAFTRTGYAFRGWATSADRANAGTVDYTDGQSVSNLTTTNNGTYNLYAVWAELVTFTIASYSNGTVTVTPNDDSGSFTSGSRDLAVGTVVTFSAVANTNYHITNVNLNIKGSDNSFSASSAYTLKTGDGTVTLTANFLPDTYAITYNAGENGTGADIAAGEKTYNEDFTLSNSTFTREGYTQTGWSTEDGGSKAYDLGDTYTGNTALDLYPYWEINTYDITFKNADGTTLKKSDDTTDAVYSVAYGETPAYDGATPTKAADSEYTYTFNAWTPAIATVTTAATYTA